MQHEGTTPDGMPRGGAQQGVNRLPIAQAYDTALDARALLQSKPWPSVPSVTLDPSVSITDVVDGLQAESFEAGWILSYHEYGSVLNLRRPDGMDTDGNQLQDHARFRVKPSGSLEGICHVEYSPIQHPEWHIEEDLVDWGLGQSVLADALEAAGIPTEKIELTHS